LIVKRAGRIVGLDGRVEKLPIALDPSGPKPLVSEPPFAMLARGATGRGDRGAFQRAAPGACPMKRRS